MLLAVAVEWSNLQADVGATRRSTLSVAAVEAAQVCCSRPVFATRASSRKNHTETHLEAAACWPYRHSAGISLCTYPTSCRAQNRIPMRSARQFVPMHFAFQNRFGALNVQVLPLDGLTSVCPGTPENRVGNNYTIVPRQVAWELGVLSDETSTALPEKNFCRSVCRLKSLWYPGWESNPHGLAARGF